ncbi:MAG: hypothetical protein QXW09_07955 [Thermoproteota archaeon]
MKIQSYFKKDMSSVAKFILAVTSTVLLILCILSTLNSLRIQYYAPGACKPQLFRINLISPEVHSTILTELFVIVVFLSILIEPRFTVSKKACYLTVTLIALVLLLFILSLEWLALSLFFISLVAATIFLVARIGLLRKTLKLVLVPFFLLELLVFVSWSFHPFFGQPEIMECLRLIQSKFSSVGEVLNPLIIILLMFSWVLLSLKLEKVNRLINAIRVKLAFPKILSFSKENGSLNIPLPYTQVILVFSVLLSVFLVVYPYSPRLNPTGRPLSVDVASYVNIMVNMTSLPTPIASIDWAFRTQERSIYLVSLYLLDMVFKAEMESIVKYSPVFLSPILVLSVYLFVKQGTGDRVAASLSAFFTACSINTVAGMVAGFFANWLALGVAYLALMLLLRFFDKRRLTYFLLSTIMFILVLFTHSWTWVLLMGVLMAHIVITFLRTFFLKENHDVKVEAFPLASMALINFLFDVFRSLILDRTSGASIGYNAANYGVSFYNLLILNQNLSYALRHYIMGFSNSFPIFILAFIGALMLAPRKDLFSRLLVSWVMAVSFVFIISGSELQSRLLYDLPIQILATFGSIGVFKKFSKLSSKTGYLTLGLAALSAANYAYMSMARLAA